MKKKIKQNTNTAGVKYCTADGNVLLQSGQPKRFSKSAALLASAAIILSAALFALGLYFLVDKVDHAAAKADEAILQEKSSEAPTKCWIWLEFRTLAFVLLFSVF